MRKSTTEEKKLMKLLKIEEGKGYFLGEDNEDQPIDELTKEDLLRMVNQTLDEAEISFDQYDEELLRNQAHQIIYKNVHAKLFRLRERKDEFKDESERLFLEDYENYRNSTGADEIPPN